MIEALRNDRNSQLSDNQIIELTVGAAKARANVVLADVTRKISGVVEAEETLDEALLVYAEYLSLIAPTWPLGHQDDALTLLVMNPSRALADEGSP